MNGLAKCSSYEVELSNQECHDGAVRGKYTILVAAVGSAIPARTNEPLSTKRGAMYTDVLLGSSSHTCGRKHQRIADHELIINAPGGLVVR